jgi:hypothetical protein
MFLPVEGLYAEVLRRPGLADTVQRDYRVLLAGPTTLWGHPEQPADGIQDARDRAPVE